MKLKNKKTGEIGELHYEPDKEYHFTVVTEDPADMMIFKTLAELNAEWQDYEEYWFINSVGGVIQPSDTTDWEQQDATHHKEIGNYFETREEAEKLVGKLKAWKRLKDKGFSFSPVDRYEALCGNGFNIPIIATMPPEAYTDVEVSKDLDICFGGEE